MKYFPIQRGKGNEKLRIDVNPMEVTACVSFSKFMNSTWVASLANQFSCGVIRMMIPFFLR